MEKIELLAPAGSPEALKAAIENGADAVYLGGSMFSARQYANNFGYEELKEAVNFAHSRGVKIYVAANTLLANGETKELIDYLYQLAKAQVDAVIVQDLGMAELIRTALPDMELHASTQMAVHNSAGVRFLEDMGFTRAVLAREVSFEDIQQIRENSFLGLETFVHGALCISYSGQCLMSSLIGGRSGNRGRCAQPCRMKYTLLDQKGQVVGNPEEIGEHLLSPRDLKMIEHIPELVAAGIVSLKIEGRMKRPEYVATVVRNYREMIDHYYSNPESFLVSQERHKELEQIFNRGFNTGYYFGNQGKELMSYKKPNNRGLLLGRITQISPLSIMVKLVEPLALGDGYEVWVTKGGRLGGEVKELIYNGQKVEEGLAGQEIEFKIGPGKPRIGDRVFKTNDARLMQRAKESFMSPKINQKLALKLKAKVEEGKVIEMIASDEEGYSTFCKGDFIVEEARKHPLDYDTMWNQLARLGNTPFELASLELEIEGQLMVPISELNQLRRKIVDNLLLERKNKLQKKVPDRKEYMEHVNSIVQWIPPKMADHSKPLLSLLVGSPNALKAGIDGGADRIYINLEGLKNRENFSLDNLKDAVLYCKEKDKKVVLRVPTIVPERNLPKLEELLTITKGFGFDGYLVGNLGMLQLAKELELENILADYTLNIFNDISLFSLLQNQIIQGTLSPELTLEQINKFNYLGNLPLETLVHGNFPLMVSEYCAVGSIKGEMTHKKTCKGDCHGGDFGLKDRLNFIFPLAMDEECRMLVFNAKPLNLYKDLKSILDTGIDSIRIEGRKERPYWIKEVTSSYRLAIDSWYATPYNFRPKEENITLLEKLEPRGSTTGHFFRGVL